MLKLLFYCLNGKSVNNRIYTGNTIRYDNSNRVLFNYGIAGDILMRISIIVIAIFLSLPLNGQNSDYSIDDAKEKLEEQQYQKAANILRSLLDRNDRNHQYNYYYGITLYHLREKLDEASRRLRFASNRAPANDLYFYLGKIYQRSFETELAVENFKKFLDNERGSSDKTEIAERAIEDCISAEGLINKYFDLKVISKDTISRDELLKHYDISEDAGTLMKAKDFFTGGVNPEQIVFRTERGDEVFFPVRGSDKSYDLYKIVKLLDSWGEAQPLGEPLNSEHNEMHPFLLIDGTTLYFSSDRPGGMGGMDIYQSFYNPDSGTFSEPANLGPPFNSPDDDFLLTPDIYEGKAMFATTRGVPEGKIVLVEIVWDETVIRNYTEDINQIKELSQLPIQKDAVPRASTTLHAAQDKREDEPETEIYFNINDTIIYTRYDHFLSSEALRAYKKGEESKQKRDSLQELMNKKRRNYAQSYNQEELQNIINKIVELESLTYTIDDKIKDHFFNARRIEIQHIEELKSKGGYTPHAEKNNRQPLSRDELTPTQKLLNELNKGELTFYSDDEFKRRKERLGEMYNTLFAPHKVKELQRLDSLYVWAGILSLESARLLERTGDVEIRQPSLRERLQNDISYQEEYDQNVREKVQRSERFKRASLDLYEQALNERYSIYYSKAMDIGATSHQAGSEDMVNQARSNFQRAESEINRIQGNNLERLENLLGLKRNSVDKLETSLNIQAAGTSNIGSSEENKRASSRFLNSNELQRSYPAIHKQGELNSDKINSEESTEKIADSEKLSIEETINKPVYKIQIGAFRNKPDQSALDKIPKTISIKTEGSDIVRYYSGSWSRYKEAEKHINEIEDAGFTGAYIVAFLNGEIISTQKAKELE
ncbi:hypothetical protein QA597_01210 [Marinilabiliaceae bacterium ANBcel2]|nr:hypothetical protein [Marinilabiliaceae bacterium ANBcel2]